MSRTLRGFAVYTEFTDERGVKVRVQKSSAAGVRRCWVFSKTSDKRIVEDVARSAVAAGVVDWAPHLTPAQARRVAKALLRFADGVE